MTNRAIAKTVIIYFVSVYALLGIALVAGRGGHGILLPGQLYILATLPTSLLIAIDSRPPNDWNFWLFFALPILNALLVGSGLIAWRRYV